jgi:uncharacterized protein YndB with AHSA1/START domain
MNTDLIEKRMELKAPVSRVWRALTNHLEFGEWFGVRLEGPFAVGKNTAGKITSPGHEKIQWAALVRKMEPEKLFSFTWHPYAIDEAIDYSKETPTLVEFRLEKIPTGTLLTVTESGFDKVPASRRDVAFRMQNEGWAIQMTNIEEHVSKA